MSKDQMGNQNKIGCWYRHGILKTSHRNFNLGSLKGFDWLYWKYKLETVSFL